MSAKELTGIENFCVFLFLITFVVGLIVMFSTNLVAGGIMLWASVVPLFAIDGSK